MLPYLLFHFLLLCLLLFIPSYSTFSSTASASPSSYSSSSSSYFFSSASSSCRCLKSSSGKGEIPYLFNQYILPFLYLQIHWPQCRCIFKLRGGASMIALLGRLVCLSVKKISKWVKQRNLT